MARLIPSFTDDQTPPGEREVFNMIASGPDDWCALHSLDLAPWNRGLRTEIDFVVIIPDTGLLCIEVKSHEMISFDGDRWQPTGIKRSPFKQAADGSNTFYRRLRELAPGFKRIPVVHCCIFPHARFDISRNLSVQPWELIDLRTFRSFRTGREFCAALRIRVQQSIQADAALSALPSPLTKKDVDEIVGHCVPLQKRHPEARLQIEKREFDIESIFRQQQKPVLQLASLNDRIVVYGGAGTGKTFISMEVARRAADRGSRVALLCFNQLIGEWLKRRMSLIAPALPNLVVGTAIKVLADITGIEIPAVPTSDFWRAELPDKIIERLTDPEFKALASFDYLVVDEAQDLLARPRIWECVTQFLAGGVENGKFALFGDFDNQVLAERPAMENALKGVLGSGNIARWRLDENCRNYRVIGETAVRLSGLAGPVYSGYMRLGGSVDDYNIFFYESEREQINQLANWLRDYRGKGYKPSEITILSFCSAELGAAARLRPEGFRLRPLWQAGDNTGYASVQAFKGLENKVVILTDVVLGAPDFFRDLFYVGMTRATDSVRVLCSKGSQDVLMAWLTGMPK